MGKKNRGNMQKRSARRVEDRGRLLGMGGVGGSLVGRFRCQSCDKQIDEWCEIRIDGQPLLVCDDCSKRFLEAFVRASFQG